LLIGCPFSGNLIVQLLEGVTAMKESTMYQRILREGRQEGLRQGQQEGLSAGEMREARRYLILLGTERFGEPDPATLAAQGAIPNVERLEALGRKLIADPALSAWEELLR
jgi:predicted transposase YdaD